MRAVCLGCVIAMLVVLAGGCAGARLSEAVLDAGKLPPHVDVATVKALQGRADVVLLDVREQSEYDAGHIDGVKLIPMSQVPSRLAEIPKDKTVIVTCRSGNRSGQVAEYLRSKGFTDVHNMLGGIIKWQAAGYPVER